MRVLLFQAPVSIRSPHAQLSPPLGLAYVAQHLLDEGHAVDLVDLNLTGLNPARITATLNRVRPELVGISSHTETYPNAIAIAQLVKQHDPGIAVILGGPHASILPLEVLAEDDVDFVAIGEGEQTAAELLRVLAAGSDPAEMAAIAGLGHRVAGVPTLNASREPLDAADIGRPARQLLSLEFYEDAHNVLAARGGCPYRCPFCSASHLWGGRRRMRPVDDVLDEVEELTRDYGAQRVFFVDDILTLDRRVARSAHGRRSRGAEAGSRGGAPRGWTASTRSCCSAWPRRAARASSSESSPAAQEHPRLGEGDSQGGRARRGERGRERGHRRSCSFMIPFPDDTEETLAQTAMFMRDIRAAGGRLLISYTTPFPGTMFYERADELGLTILTDDWSLYDCKHVVMETKNLSQARIEALAHGIADDLGMMQTE